MEGVTLGRIQACSCRIPIVVWTGSSVGVGRVGGSAGFGICGHGLGRRRSVVRCCNGDKGNSYEASSSSAWGRGEGEDSEGDRLRRENSELRASNSELQASLAELSQSLASISVALADVSRAVQLVARAVDCGPSENGVLESAASAATPSAPELADAVPEISGNQNEPLSPLPSVSNSQESEVQGETQDPVQAQLMEQNIKTHNLAYRLQQAFIQARIEGLGKPFQLAAEDFVTTCLEAHAMGIGLKELQLQLILLEGSLTGAFSIRNQRYTDDPVMSEESRVRSSWVRLVYATLAEVKERRSRVEYAATEVGKEREKRDPSDSFVTQLVTLAFERGYDLERVKLEQNVSGPVTSGAIRTMRQCTYLVLLTLQKITNDAL